MPEGMNVKKIESLYGGRGEEKESEGLLKGRPLPLGCQVGTAKPAGC